MADAIEGFKWLREFNDNVEWFAQHGEEVGVHLGAGPAFRTVMMERLIIAAEHAKGLTNAIEKLRGIVNGTDR